MDLPNSQLIQYEQPVRLVHIVNMGDDVAQERLKPNFPVTPILPGVGSSKSQLISNAPKMPSSSQQFPCTAISVFLLPMFHISDNQCFVWEKHFCKLYGVKALTKHIYKAHGREKKFFRHTAMHFTTPS